MCGIAGIFDMKGERDIDRAALKRMTDALAHRGPDGEGYYAAQGLGFGHRRLAVLDKEGGAQPFHAQTRDCVLCFNGEIYNYRSLAANFPKQLALKTRSDTEILAEGLALNGRNFIHDLNGMFAFAFWNPRQKRLTLGRDRLGEKPLYYATTSDGFLIFASEMRALLASRMIDAELNMQAFADYCFYGYVPDPKTIYRDVYKLPPGHTLVIEPDKPFLLEQYWRPVFTDRSELSFDAAADQLRERLDAAVRAQMIADAPLGAFLSGGADSSGVVASMAQTTNELITCGVGFDEAKHDERAFARTVAEKFRANHHEYVASCADLELIDKAAAALGEPFADSAALPSFIVARLAREHVTVALSGDGGDEIFAGYRRYPFFLAEEKLRRATPTQARRIVFGPAGAVYPKLDWAPQLLRFKTTFQALAQPSEEAYANAVAINLPMRIEAMMSSEARRSLQGYRPQSLIGDAMSAADSNDPLDRALYADLMTWLPGRMLVKIDRTSMAHSLEVRPPLLDYRLVEWACALPSVYKLKGKDGKRILKRALEPRLGRDFLNRKKQGFAPPLAQWMRRDKNNPLHLLNDSRLWRESGLFNAAAVERMARKHQNGASDCAQELWTVIMFDAFLRCAKGACEQGDNNSAPNPLISVHAKL